MSAGGPPDAGEPTPPPRDTAPGGGSQVFFLRHLRLVEVFREIGSPDRHRQEW